jgi:hypothetical protein
MVDVTFPFVILFGGPLAALVTALVRRHRGWRRVADILVAAICGPLTWTGWMLVVPRLLDGRDPAATHPSLAYLLSDLLWFSPVIGGFFGLALVAVAYGIVGAPPVRPGETVGEKLGDAIRIVGYVYGIIGLALAIALVALAIAMGETQVLSVMLLFDVAVGAYIVLIGWALERASRRIGAATAKPTSQ